MGSYFITATGTGIGKTLVTCMLAWQLRERGIRVRALKPIISGWVPGDNDTENILESLRVPITPASIQAISPWRFQAPLSPDMAAVREGKILDFEEIVTFCMPLTHETLLIEGAGGIMTPIGQGKTMVDLVAALPVETILVTGSYLGTLSHTLTALEVLAYRQIALKGVIVSESTENPVPLEETVAALQQYCLAPVIALPRLKTAQPYKTPLNIVEMLSMIG